MDIDRSKLTEKPVSDAGHDAQAALCQAAGAWLQAGLREHLAPEVYARVAAMMQQGMRIEITTSVPDGTVGAFAIDANGKRVCIFVLTPSGSRTGQH